MTTGGGMGGSSGEVDTLYIDIQARVEGVERTLREMEQQVTESGERAGGGLKDKFGGAIAALPAMATAAAAAVGAALAAGVVGITNLAMEAEGNVKMFQASLGATAEEAENLGKAAEEVFRNNWGESLTEAAEMVKNVRQEIKGLAEEDIAAVTNGTAAIADTFGEEQQRVAASVQAVMDATGASATEAMDLITVGFQRGLNSSGDFLDTLMEYGPQFKKAGLDAGELYSLLETGAGKGALGTDKVADAFKEFGLTMVEVTDDSKALYAELGIDHQKMVDDINSGAITQGQAFQMVKDGLEQVQGTANKTRIAAAIFGGAGEDAAGLLEQVELTEASINDLGTTTDKLNAKYTSLKDVAAGVWREVQVALLPVGKEILALANEAMPAIKEGISSAMPVVLEFARGLVQGIKQGKEAFGTMQPYIQQVVAVLQPVIASLGSAFQAAFTLVKTLWETVLKPVITALQPLISGVLSGVGTALNGALQLVTRVFNAVSALLRGDASAAWRELKAAVVGVLSSLGRAIDQSLMGIGESTYRLGVAAVDGFKRGAVALKDWLVNLVKDAVSNAASGIGGWISNGLSNLSSAVGIGGGGVTSLPAFGQLLSNIGVANYAVNQEFGANKNRLNYGPYGHNGVDVATPTGTKLFAPISGRVSIGQDAYLGRYVKLVDASGTEVRLGHLSQYNQELVKALRDAGGSINVAKGALLGLSGGGLNDPGRGNSTGSHLHIDVKRGGRFVDPRAWLNANGTGIGGGGIDFGTAVNTSGVTSGKSNTLNISTALDPRELAANERTFGESLQRMSAINKAAREGRIADARLEQQELDALKTQALARVEGNAAAEYEVEKKYAGLLRDAKAAIARAEREARDADIRSNTELTAQQRTDALARSERELNTELLGIRNEYDAAISRADEAIQGHREGLAARQLEVSRMTADAEIDLAQRRAESVVAEYERQKEGVGDSLVEQLAFETSWQDTLIAARTQAETAETRRKTLALERQRNAEINKEGTTLEQRRAIWEVYAGKIAAEEQALADTLLDIATASGAALVALSEKISQQRLDASSDQNASTAEAFINEAKRLLAEGKGLDEVLAYLGQGQGFLDRIAADGGDTALGLAMLAQYVGELTGALGELSEADQALVRAGGIFEMKAVEVPELTFDDSWQEFLDGLDADKTFERFQQRLAEMDDAGLTAMLQEISNSTMDTATKTLAYNAVLAQLKSNTEQATANSTALTESNLRLQEAQASLAGAVDQSKRPFADQILALENLRGKPGVIAQDLELLIAQWQALQAEVEKKNALEAAINKWSNYAKQALPVIVSGIEALGLASGEVAGQWGEDLGRMTNDITNFAMALAKGDYVAAAVQGLMTIFSWLNRNAEAARKAAKATADYNAQFRFSQNGYGTRQVETYSTGILFWQTTHYKESVNEAQKELALALEGGFVNGIKSGFKAALEANDFDLFKSNLRENVGAAVLDGLIDAFMNEAVLAGIIGPAIQEYMATGDASVLSRAVDDASTASEQFYNDLQGIRKELGLDSGSGGSAGGNTRMIGTAPGAQLASPRWELPPVLTQGLTDFAATMPIFREGSEALLRAGQKLEAQLDRAERIGAPLHRGGAL